jgi:hypothetical protein
MDIRYQPGQPVQISLLGSRELMSGRIVEMADRAATIEIDRPLAFGASVRIHFEDSMLLGEVSTCKSGPEKYLITVQVSEAVPVLSDLGRLVTAVMAGGRHLDVEQGSSVRIGSV